VDDEQANHSHAPSPQAHHAGNSEAIRPSLGRRQSRELQIHAARIFGPRWSFGCPTPADLCFDGPPIIDSPANWLHQNWPLLQADRRKLLAAHAAWKATAA